MSSAKPDQSYGVEMYGFSDFVHVPTKKAHYDAWSSSTGSTSGCSSSCSPNHLEELHVDIPHSSTASVASTSTASHSSPETAANAAVRAPVPTFTDLKPISPKDSPSTIASALALASEVLANAGSGADMTPAPSSFSTTPQQTYQSSPAPEVIVPLAPKPIYPNVPSAVQSGNHPVITHDARFSSYAEFDEAFEAWKRECLHPFRVASSETLREPDGTVNHRFKYRYVVFHCAHYGEPRMRGIGKRPNQHYLPSGCRAMLRLNYSFSEQLLKITTLHDEHLNHEVSAEMFRKVSAKLKRSSCGAPSPASKRSRLDSPGESSQNMQSPLVGQSSPLTTNSHMATSGANSGANSLAAQISLAQPNAMTSVAIALQQQQIMASLLNQQKENINLAAGLSTLGIPRAQPSMLNILSMMGLQQRMLLQQQPAYGLMSPLTQQFATAPQAQPARNTEGKPNVSDAEQQNPAKKDLPAPVALKPNATSSGSSSSQLELSPGSSPPHLVAEAPVPASEVSSNATAPSTPPAFVSGTFEESLARFRNGGQDSEIMTRIAQLNSLSSFWGTPTISEFR